MLPEEYNWFLSHPETVNQYPGEYIAIVDEAVVAHGKDLKAVFSEAEKYGKPLVHKVPRADKELII